MSLPRQLLVVTAEYSGDFECRGEHYQQVVIFDRAELHEKITLPDLDAGIANNEFSESEIDRNDLDNFFESAAWGTTVADIEQWGRGCEVDTHCINLDKLSSSDINLLADLRGYNQLYTQIGGLTMTGYTREVFNELTVETKRVVTFLGKEVTKYD